MKKTLAFTLVPLGVIAGVIVLNSFLVVPETIAAAPVGIDVAHLERDAAKETTRSFDDLYQMHTGVLDELRTYP